MLSVNLEGIRLFKGYTSSHLVDLDINAYI